MMLLIKFVFFCLYCREEDSNCQRRYNQYFLLAITVSAMFIAVIITYNFSHANFFLWTRKQSKCNNKTTTSTNCGMIVNMGASSIPHPPKKWIQSMPITIVIAAIESWRQRRRQYRACWANHWKWMMVPLRFVPLSPSPLSSVSLLSCFCDTKPWVFVNFVHLSFSCL